MNEHVRSEYILQRILQKAYTGGLTITLKTVPLAWQSRDLEAHRQSDHTATLIPCTPWAHGKGKQRGQGPWRK